MLNFAPSTLQRVEPQRLQGLILAKGNNEKDRFINDTHDNSLLAYGPMQDPISQLIQRKFSNLTMIVLNIDPSEVFWSEMMPAICTKFATQLRHLCVPIAGTALHHPTTLTSLVALDSLAVTFWENRPVNSDEPGAIRALGTSIAALTTLTSLALYDFKTEPEAWSDMLAMSFVALPLLRTFEACKCQALVSIDASRWSTCKLVRAFTEHTQTIELPTLVNWEVAPQFPIQSCTWACPSLVLFAVGNSLVLINPPTTAEPDVTLTYILELGSTRNETLRAKTTTPVPNVAEPHILDFAYVTDNERFSFIVLVGDNTRNDNVAQVLIFECRPRNEQIEYPHHVESLPTTPELFHHFTLESYHKDDTFTKVAFSGGKKTKPHSFKIGTSSGQVHLFSIPEPQGGRVTPVTLALSDESLYVKMTPSGQFLDRISFLMEGATDEVAIAGNQIAVNKIFSNLHTTLITDCIASPDYSIGCTLDASGVIALWDIHNQGALLWKIDHTDYSGGKIHFSPLDYWLSIVHENYITIYVRLNA